MKGMGSSPVLFDQTLSYDFPIEDREKSLDVFATIQLEIGHVRMLEYVEHKERPSAG